jgi:hypothetical protein
MTKHTPDFESIKQTNPYGVEYWSARSLAPLLGYVEWRNFETVVIAKAKIACEQASQNISDHFVDATKGITGGKGSIQNVSDYHLSRFACYLVAMNGDPRKPAIAEEDRGEALSLRGGNREARLSISPAKVRFIGEELSLASIPPPRRDRASPLSLCEVLPTRYGERRLCVLSCSARFCPRDMESVASVCSARFSPLDSVGAAERRLFLILQEPGSSQQQYQTPAG